MPGKVGMISGLFFGFAFGVGGLGAAVLGVLADHIGIERVYELCASCRCWASSPLCYPRSSDRTRSASADSRWGGRGGWRLRACAYASRQVIPGGRDERESEG